MFKLFCIMTRRVSATNFFKKPSLIVLKLTCHRGKETLTNKNKSLVRDFISIREGFKKEEKCYYEMQVVTGIKEITDSRLL